MKDKFQIADLGGGGNQLVPYPVSYTPATTGNSSNPPRQAFSNKNTVVLKLAALQSPSTLIQLIETTRSNGGRTNIEDTSGGFRTFPPTQDATCGPNPPSLVPGGGAGTCVSSGSMFAGHMGTANYLFADGHVKAMKPLATLYPTNLYDRDNLPFTNSIYGSGTTFQTAVQNNLSFAETTFQ